MKIERPIIFFDLETTGVDITKDRIVQIAMIKLFEDGSKVEKSSLINPTIPIPKEASEIHGIYDKDVKDALTFDQIAQGIVKFFSGCDIGGYNSNSYDLPLLLEELKRCGLSLDLEGVKLLDVFRFEKQLNPMTLGAVFQRYTGKELESAHDALADVKATLEIFEKQYDKIIQGGVKVLEEELKRPPKITPTELLDVYDKFSQGDTPRVDLSGKLQYINKELCWTFGKHKNKPVINDLDYVNWFLSTNVPEDTREFIEKALNDKNNTK